MVSLRFAMALTLAVALALQAAPTVAQTTQSISDSGVLDELATIRPDPRWSAEQQRRAREISSAGVRFSSALKDLQNCQKKVVSNLDKEIARLESEQERAKNERQSTSTSFQNADQKYNQMLDMLSRVLKTMKEARMGAARNLL